VTVDFLYKVEVNYAILDNNQYPPAFYDLIIKMKIGKIRKPKADVEIKLRNQI